MLLLPVVWQNGLVKLLVILEDENIERIKEHDCAEVIWSQLGPAASKFPESITIGYATAEDLKKIQKWAQEGNFAEAIKLVTGGFKYRPERGDHDFGPISLTKKEN